MYHITQKNEKWRTKKTGISIPTLLGLISFEFLLSSIPVEFLQALAREEPRISHGVGANLPHAEPFARITYLLISPKTNLTLKPEINYKLYATYVYDKSKSLQTHQLCRLFVSPLYEMSNKSHFPQQKLPDLELAY